MKKEIIPGATILIGRHGKIAYFKTYGMQDKGEGVPMKKDTIFRVYSMSKPVTAVGIMMLWEEGKFILSDRVSKFLPELKGLKVGVKKKDPQTGNSTLELVPCNREMTIQDLLRHTSGMIYESPFFGKSLVQQSGQTQKFGMKMKPWPKQRLNCPSFPCVFSRGPCGTTVDQ